MLKSDWLRLIICIVICIMAGIVGSIFTSRNIPTWYATINKPTFNPPNWVFAPVWTTLYLMMGISLFLIWRQRNAMSISPAIYFFAIQLILNTLWSVIFFGMKLLLVGFIEICILMDFYFIIHHFILRNFTCRITFLIPYLLWVSYASVLNFSIYKLNS